MQERQCLLICQSQSAHPQSNAQITDHPCLQNAKSYQQFGVDLNEIKYKTKIYIQYDFSNHYRSQQQKYLYIIYDYCV